MKPFTGLLLLILLFVYSCKKDSFITSSDAEISFSSDTLFYDTVFSTVGSVTKFIRIFNNNDQKLKLASVEIAGGSSSPFRINVDGTPGNANNLEILPNDSLYVFVSVQVNQSSQDLPFIIQDSIRIRFNGTERYVQLQAWGQNAVFLRNHIVTGNETWTNEKPYVILERLIVNKDAKLTISRGSRIYFHANAPLLVDGTLEIRGDKADSLRVILQGDRLDDPYRNYPGAWPGIYLRKDSHDNLVEYAVIKNAYQGIVADELSGNGLPKLLLNQSIIQNCFDAGIIGIHSDIRATNTLVANCGKNIILAFGGRYEFNHLTNVGYSNAFIAHKSPVISITNVYEDAGAVFVGDLNASFVNCIFWGEDGLVKDEVVVRKEGNSLFAVKFENSIWKVNSPPAGITSAAMKNQDPLFNLVETDKRLYDFRLKDNSPAISAGKSTGLLLDLDGNARKPIPDAGAYERQ